MATKVTVAKNQNSIRWRKKPWANPGSVGGSVLLWPMNEKCMIMIQVAL